MATTKTAPPEQTREQIEAEYAAARAKRDELDRIQNEKNADDQAAQRRRSESVYELRLAQGPDVERLATEDRDAARVAAVESISASPLGQALARYIAAELNLEQVRRDLDQAASQVRRDFSQPGNTWGVGPILEPRDPLAIMAGVIVGDGRDLFDATTNTRRSHVADYVAGRAEEFSPLVGLSTQDADPTAVVVGGLAPTPDTRTQYETDRDRGLAVTPPVDPDPVPIPTHNPFLGGK